MANQPKQNRENKKVIWNSSLRPKVGDVVEYNGVFYTNLTGLNTEPGVGSDWARQFLINDIKEIPNRSHKDLQDLPSRPFGLEGQIYKIKTDNTDDFQVEDSIIIGNYIKSDAELDASKNNTDSFTTFEDIFNKWKRFSHNGSTIPSNVSETQEWEYISASDKIQSTINSVTYIGVVSEVKLSKYTLTSTLTADNADNDRIGIVIAFVEDKNDLVLNQAFGLDPTLYKGINTTDEYIPNQHTLTLLRTRDQVISQYFVVYDYNKTTQQIILNGTNLVATTTSNWSGATVDVKVERNEDIIKTSTLNFSDLVQDVTFADTELVIDLNSNPVLEKFKGPARYGFSANSQFGSTYINTSVSGTGLNEIYDIRNGDIYEADSSGVWTKNTSRNLDNELLERSILYNPLYHSLLFYNKLFDFKVIGEKSGKITVDLTETLSVKFPASEELIIYSITNLKNTPTVSILINGVSYTLGNRIEQGDEIVVSVDIYSQINLNLL